MNTSLKGYIVVIGFLYANNWYLTKYYYIPEEYQLLLNDNCTVSDPIMYKNILNDTYIIYVKIHDSQDNFKYYLYNGNKLACDYEETSYIHQALLNSDKLFIRYKKIQKEMKCYIFGTEYYYNYLNNNPNNYNHYNNLPSGLKSSLTYHPIKHIGTIIFLNIATAMAALIFFISIK